MKCLNLEQEKIEKRIAPSSLNPEVEKLEKRIAPSSLSLSLGGSLGAYVGGSGSHGTGSKSG